MDAKRLPIQASGVIVPSNRRLSERTGRQFEERARRTLDNVFCSWRFGLEDRRSEAHIEGMKNYEVKVRQTTGGWIWELHDGSGPSSYRGGP